MTKKDYIRFAELVRNWPWTDEHRTLAWALAVVFIDDNPRFSWPKFAKACGIQLIEQ